MFSTKNFVLVIMFKYQHLWKSICLSISLSTLTVIFCLILKSFNFLCFVSLCRQPHSCTSQALKSRLKRVKQIDISLSPCRQKWGKVVGWHHKLLVSQIPTGTWSEQPYISGGKECCLASGSFYPTEFRILPQFLQVLSLEMIIPYTFIQRETLCMNTLLTPYYMIILERGNNTQHVMSARPAPQCDKKTVKSLGYLIKSSFFQDCKPFFKIFFWHCIPVIFISWSGVWHNHIVI